MKKKDQFPMENEGGGLPARAQNGAERRIAPTFDASGASAREKPPKKQRSGGYVMILSICLMVAIFLLFYSMVLFLEYTAPQEITEESSREESSESERIVFVRQWDENSGILSTPEIYASCVEGVVSVRATRPTGSDTCFGFLISEDGYIAVPSSVLEGAESLLVQLWNGTSYPALRAGSDAQSELGLLKIEERGLRALSFGESRELLMGDRVVLMGSEGVCTGEISSCRKTLLVRDEAGALVKKLFSIRVNAPATDGYEGAPLMNEYGEVVGMMIDRADGSGVGYALPSDGVKGILSCMMAGEPIGDELLESVAIPAPTLGIVGGSASEEGMLGVRIHRFSSGLSSSAQMLKAGDLVLAVDGVAVRTVEEIAAAIEPKNPKDTVFVSVLRFGQMLTFEVTLS